MTLIHVLEVSIHLHSVALAGFHHVFAVVVHLVHFYSHVVVDAQGFRDGIVGVGINHHVLSTEIADDVWLIKTYIVGREECVLIVALAVCVRHCGGVNLAAEVAF